MSDLRFESPGQKQARRQASEDANVEAARLLAEMREQVELERQAREAGEKRSTRREVIALIIGGLTLGATILFGVLALLR